MHTVHFDRRGQEPCQAAESRLSQTEIQTIFRLKHPGQTQDLQHNKVRSIIYRHPFKQTTKQFYYLDFTPMVEDGGTKHRHTREVTEMCAVKSRWYSKDEIFILLLVFIYLLQFKGDVRPALVTEVMKVWRRQVILYNWMEASIQLWITVILCLLRHDHFSLKSNWFFSPAYSVSLRNTSIHSKSNFRCNFEILYFIIST